MRYELILDTQAEDDIADAALWYEEQRTGLGEQFVLRFEEALDLLAENPHIFAQVYSHFRRALMKQFPYAIFYSIDVSQAIVEVIGVFHGSRNPEIIKKRLSL